MIADPELSKLGEALREVGERLGADDTHAALRAIFAANNEIGRLSRTRGVLRESLVQLQMDVNLVTLELKRGRSPEARAAFARADEAFGRMSRSRGGLRKNL